METLNVRLFGSAGSGAAETLRDATQTALGPDLVSALARLIALLQTAHATHPINKRMLDDARKLPIASQMPVMII